MALIDLYELEHNNGICYLAINNSKVVGMVMGMIPPYDEFDYLDYKCPKRGVVTELVVTSSSRSKGTGTILMDAIEKYFKDNGCEYSLVDVFAYNINGINFYSKNDYHARMYVDIKKL